MYKLGLVREQRVVVNVKEMKSVNKTQGEEPREVARRGEALYSWREDGIGSFALGRRCRRERVTL